MNCLKLSKQSLLVTAIALSQTMMLPVFAGDGSVRVAGQAVITNQATGGGMSVDARTDAIQKNLDNAIVAAKDRSPSSVNVVYVKGEPVITLGGYQIITVDALNAR